jgi:hypothetical protein
MSCLGNYEMAHVGLSGSGRSLTPISSGAPPSYERMALTERGGGSNLQYGLQVTPLAAYMAAALSASYNHMAPGTKPSTETLDLATATNTVPILPMYGTQRNTTNYHCGQR